ncbi:hypothetical protein ESN35_06075 [Bifidobacterium pullorum subsp. gallinarum]|uniref:Uncharacterized protein n=1 Tax=Bifidobacterium pullorum subsp. gallinarum TaxID=78344 RepID=A0A4P6DTP2_9BIFI|nr:MULTISPECIES: hypothetical protein [Bifidobacterium]MBS5401135.1 hypothetical protein [Bifidobacterium sp.]QAY33016.1 hypothetical protein ESN35_06075 [Bifidobacterium pullorum subsp. gallinarum]
MPVQDDSRENQMIDKFNLTVPPDRGRSDIDAHLKIDGLDIPFELKSTTRGSIATARDFGIGHITKWRNNRIHWLFGFYLSSEEKADYYIYCSPDDMEPWYTSMESYIKPDVILGKSLPDHVSEDMVRTILGEKEIYSYEDAQTIMKRQYTASQYRKLMDAGRGYSIERMTEILKARALYVFARGSTLNNPHIPANYFDHMTHITDEPAITLRQMVHAYLVNKRAIDDAAA